MNIEKKTLYWLAGLLEAEGSFIAHPPSAPNTPTISISMTDEDIIGRFAAIFGVKYCPWRSKNENHKITYIAHLKGIRAVDLMRELYPLMSQRRQQQIDRALENHLYKADQKGENNGFVKLTEAQVKEIKIRLTKGESQTHSAKPF